MCDSWEEADLVCKMQAVRTINTVLHTQTTQTLLRAPAHTVGRQTWSFFQSNFGENEMGDELQREGWRMSSALNYKIQKQIALLSICSLPHTLIHTRSCNLLSHSDILLLFHSISPVLRQIPARSLQAQPKRESAVWKEAERMKDSSAIFSACVQPCSQLRAVALNRLFFLLRCTLQRQKSLIWTPGLKKEQRQFLELTK